MLIRHPKKRKTQEKKGKWLNVLESSQSLSLKKKQFFENSNSEASLSSVGASWGCFLPREKAQA